MAIIGWIKTKFGYERKDIHYNPNKLKEGESKKMDWRGRKWLQKRNGVLEMCELDKTGRPICKPQKTKKYLN